MKHIRRSICLLVLCLLSDACNVGSPTDAEKSTVAPAKGADSNRASVAAASVSQLVATTSLDGIIKKDMAYADARKALLAHDWTPEKDKECKTNVGANEKLCKSSPNLNLCTVCDEMPELSAYSDEGLAVTHFKQGAQRLTLDSSGSLSDWKIPGDNSRLVVTNWRITSATSPDKTSPH